MIEQLLAISRNTFVQSIRQPIYLVLVGIGVLALVMNLSLSSFTMDDDNQFLMDMGMATIFLVGLFIAAFIATSVLSREIEDKTVLTVVAKPVGRPLFILGKYLGVSGAILVATVILSCAFLLTVRHQVLQRASDQLDWPVIIFGFSAVFLAVGIGTWGNYFYGWVFTSTTVKALFPLSILAWLGIIIIGKEWDIQLFSEEWHGYISPDFTPEVFLALFALALALLVMASIAVAASARFGQVLTIVICLIAFMLGLLSDHLFGRRAFEAQPLARITEVEYGRDIDDDFSDEGDWYSIRVAESLNLKEGMRVEVTSDPMGLSSLLENPGSDRADHVITRNLDRVKLELAKVDDVRMRRIPRRGDYLMNQPPQTKMVWRILWSIPPNLQFLILIDPITQGHYIPIGYIGKVTLYSLLYILATLSLGVILFQTREVG